MGVSSSTDSVDDNFASSAGVSAPADSAADRAAAASEAAIKFDFFGCTFTFISPAFGMPSCCFLGAGRGFNGCADLIAAARKGLADCEICCAPFLSRSLLKGDEEYDEEDNGVEDGLVGRL